MWHSFHWRVACVVVGASLLFLGGVRAQTAERPGDRGQPASGPGFVEKDGIRLYRPSVGVDPNGNREVMLSYFSSGAPVDTAIVFDHVFKVGEETRTEQIRLTQLMTGDHLLRFKLYRPVPVPFTTLDIKVSIRKGSDVLLSTSMSGPTFAWGEAPASPAAMPSDPETLLEQAAVLIDVGRKDQLQRARTILQGLVEKDATRDGVYVEMARLVMIEGQGDPASFVEAEKLLKSALAINPASLKPRVMLIHAYTWQQRYGDAEAIAIAIASASP